MTMLHDKKMQDALVLSEIHTDHDMFLGGKQRLCSCVSRLDALSGCIWRTHLMDTLLQEHRVY